LWDPTTMSWNSFFFGPPSFFFFPLISSHLIL
jgi:hypothetical protein